MKDLERARPVDESCPARRRAEAQSDRSRSPWSLAAEEARLESARKIEQLPDGHARLARIIAPRRDRLGDALVETEQAILGGRQRRQPQKAFVPL